MRGPLYVHTPPKEEKSIVKRLIKIPIIVLAALWLAACDLTDEAQRLRDQLASLNLVLQDSAHLTGTLQSQLPQAIWITLKKVEVENETGTTVTIYDAGGDGQVVNLVSPDDVAALLASSTVPAGRYTALRLTAGTDVRVVKADGTTLNLQVPDATPPDFTLDIPFKAPVDLASGDLRTLILNIDLASLSDAIDEATQTFDLAKLIDTSTDTTTLSGIQARLEGHVDDINVTDGRFLLKRDDSPDVTVTLHATLAVIVHESDGRVLTLNDLQPGDEVSVFGTFDPTRLNLLAVAVSVDPQPVARGDSQSVMSQRVEVEGRIQGFDSGTGSAQVQVHEASFLPDQSVITVIDLQSAVYAHGSPDQLQVGAKVEIKGTWDGNQLDADLVDIEGALPSQSATGMQGPVEVKGTVDTWEAQNRALTLTLTEVEGASDLNPGDALTLDLSGAWFKRGAPDCLAPGVELELKGVPGSQGTGLDATVVKVEGGCPAFPVAHDDTDDDRSGNDGEHDQGMGSGSDDADDDQGDSDHSGAMDDTDHDRDDDGQGSRNGPDTNHDRSGSEVHPGSDSDQNQGMGGSADDTGDGDHPGAMDDADHGRDDGQGSRNGPDSDHGRGQGMMGGPDDGPGQDDRD